MTNYFFTANPRLSKIITLDAVVLHLVAIYSTNENGIKQSQNEQQQQQPKQQRQKQKTSSSGSNSANTSDRTKDRTVSEYSISSTSTNAEEGKFGLEEISSEEESWKKLMNKLLDTLKIVKECILYVKQKLAALLISRQCIFLCVF